MKSIDWGVIIAMMLRCYNGAITLDSMKRMGFRQFIVLMDGIDKVMKMERGEQIPLEGKAAVEAMKRFFGSQKEGS